MKSTRVSKSTIKQKKKKKKNEVLTSRIPSPTNFFIILLPVYLVCFFLSTKFSHYLSKKKKKTLWMAELPFTFICRMETLERTSTKILLSVMKGVLQNWVAELWRYLSLPIFSGCLFDAKLFLFYQ